VMTTLGRQYLPVQWKNLAVKEKNLAPSNFTFLKAFCL
jgi:hypothetical protein